MTEARHRPRVASRRGFLAGTALAVVSGAGGVIAGLVVRRSPDESASPRPDVLIAAAAEDERALLAALGGDLAAHPTATLRAIQADHEEHLAALAASIAAVVGSPSPSIEPPPAPGRLPLGAAHLRKLESAAARLTAQRALELTGRDGALLASIAACEASHAELLS